MLWSPPSPPCITLSLFMRIFSLAETNTSVFFTNFRWKGNYCAVFWIKSLICNHKKSLLSLLPISLHKRGELFKVPHQVCIFFDEAVHWFWHTEWQCYGILDVPTALMMCSYLQTPVLEQQPLSHTQRAQSKFWHLFPVCATWLVH